MKALSTVFFYHYLYFFSFWGDEEGFGVEPGTIINMCHKKRNLKHQVLSASLKVLFY